MNKQDTGAHYRFQIQVPVMQEDLQRGYVVANIDPYRIASIYGVTNHALFSALKKILCAGGRGFKDISRDIADSIGALQRWQEMQEENTALTKAKEACKLLKYKGKFSTGKLSEGIGDDKSKLADAITKQHGLSNSEESDDLQEALKIKRL